MDADLYITILTYCLIVSKGASKESIIDIDFKANIILQYNSTIVTSPYRRKYFRVKRKIRDKTLKFGFKFSVK